MAELADHERTVGIMADIRSDILEQLRQYNQEHLLQWWDELSTAERQSLTQLIQEIDFPTIRRVWEKSQTVTDSAANISAVPRAERAAAPKSVVRQPQSEADHAARQAHEKVGNQLLAEGKVAVITVAGGQGSRLGFDLPKGMFPIGPVSNATLFQIFAEQIQARRQRHGGSLPWLIMTSSATHDDTVAYFQQQQFFGLEPGTVHFFQQGSMPAVDAATGKVLMSDKASPCLSPDGHGGLVTALRSSGLLDMMKRQGVEHFFYHQVDNPTVIMCDPALLGVHHQQESQLTTNVVKKVTPTERMGVLVDMDGRLEIIEYSELTEEQASRTDESGQWVFWAGNTAIHVFTRSFMEQLTEGAGQLELHLAHKKVAHIDETGNFVEPDVPNANKFERFIFDALPLARNALIVEGDRQREFNPVKNGEGSDSPHTARTAISRIAKEWLAAAGYELPDNARAEISPLVALDAEQLRQRLSTGEISLQDLIDDGT